MRLIIENRIQLLKADLPKGALTKIKEAFRYHNPAFFRAQNMGYYTGNIPRVIGTFKVEDNGTLVTVPRGGLEKLLEILGDFDLVPEIIDCRAKKGSTVEFNFDPTFKLRPYQKIAVDIILKAETCLIEGAPASGKTEIILYCIAKAGCRTGVLVHDRTLFNQWIESINKRLGIPKKEIGRVGLGKFKLGNRITVMMQQTARNKLDQLEDYFDFLACDEVHHYAAKTLLETVDAIDAYYRVGASATVKRQDLKHFLTYDLFGKIVWGITRKELVDLGYTTEIELHIVYTDFEYDYQNIAALTDYLDDKFTDYEDLTAKELKKLSGKLELEPKDAPQYLDAIASDSDRNNLIFKWVKKEYDNGSTCIIFTKRREQCKQWQESLKKVGLECVIFWGAKGKRKEEKRIEKDLKRLKSKEVRIAIGTVLDEGIDMPAVDAGFITYRNAGNPGQLEQQAGRLARLFTGKDVGRLYYFHDINIDKFSNDKRSLSKRFNGAIVHAKTRRRKKIRRKR